MSEEMNTDNWPKIEAQSKSILPQKVVAHIERVQKEPHAQSSLIGVLHTLQEAVGYLDPKQLDAVAQLMQIPAAKVTGVATFYHFFRLRPKGRFVISLCMGTACYVKGAPGLLEAITKELGVDIGETTKDGVFSLELARCVGTCGLAPVMTIDGEIHGPLKPDDVPALLKKYREKAAKNESVAQ